MVRSGDLVYAATPEDVEIRRRSILRTASQVIAARGVAGCTLAEVSKQSGHSIGMIQHYFGKRDNLIHSCIEHQSMAAHREWQRIASQSSSPLNTLHNLLAFAVEGDEPFEASWGFWLQVYAAAHIDPTIRDTVGDALAIWRSLFVDAITSAQSSGAVAHHVNADDVATLVVAVTDGLAIQALSNLYGNTPTSMLAVLHQFTASQLHIDATMLFASDPKEVQ